MNRREIPELRVSTFARGCNHLPCGLRNWLIVHALTDIVTLLVNRSHLRKRFFRSSDFFGTNLVINSLSQVLRLIACMA